MAKRIRLLHSLTFALAMAGYIAAVVLLIQWVTLSFAVTDNGPIRWAEGWTEVEDQWSD